MTINEYQQKAMRTAEEKGRTWSNVALGLCGESGEVADLVKKYLHQGHPMDRAKFMEELGDVAWYLALGATVLDCTLEEVLQVNIDKLTGRYPDGFDPGAELAQGGKAVTIMQQWKDASPVPTESNEQQTLFEWANRQQGRWPELKMLYHIPNEGKRSVRTGARLKAEGLKTGVPDICLPVARGGHHGLYIELKRRKNSRVTQDQLAWIADLVAQGYVAAVCRGCVEAIALIEGYLEGRL